MNVDKLKNDEVNLKNKNINCKFSNGFEKIKDNYSYNMNDIEGDNFFNKILLLLFLFMFRKYFIRFGNFNKIIIFLLICSISNTFINRKIAILYKASSIISSNIRTPPYLDRKKFFPQHELFENPDNFKKIKNEVMKIYKQKQKLQLTKNTFGNQN